MQQARAPWTDPHRRRRPRLTTRSRSGRPAAEPDVIDAFASGLFAARLLKQHFGELFASHIARQPATPPQLLTCVEAFLHLAQLHLLETDAGDDVVSVRGEMSMDALFAPRSVTSDYALAMLEGELSLALFHPQPWYYGVPREGIVEHDLAEAYLVATALLVVTGRTDWRLDLAPDWWDGLLPPTTAALVGSLPTLEADTDMLALTHRLDALVVWGERELGTLIRFVHGTTDNPYADYAYDDVVEMGSGISWTWSTDALQGEKAAQTQARCLDMRYGDLERRVRTDPDLLGKLVRAIVAVGALERCCVIDPDAIAVDVPLFPELFNDLTTIPGVTRAAAEAVAALPAATVPDRDPAAG